MFRRDHPASTLPLINYFMIPSLPFHNVGEYIGYNESASAHEHAIIIAGGIQSRTEPGNAVRKRFSAKGKTPCLFHKDTAVQSAPYRCLHEIIPCVRRQKGQNPVGILVVDHTENDMQLFHGQCEQAFITVEILKRW